MTHVVVTGAAGGLGEATSRLLAARGWSVLGADLPSEQLDRVGSREGITAVPLDVTDPASLSALAETVRSATSGGLDGVVNFAGILEIGPMAEMPEKTLRQLLDVNVMGTFAVNQVLFEQIVSAKGRIVNISSETGWQSGGPFNGAYAMSKHAIEAYSDSLRREAAMLGVKVIKVQPGPFRTGMVDSIGRRFEDAAANSRWFAGPLRRTGELAVGEQDRAHPPVELAEVVFRALSAPRPANCLLGSPRAQPRSARMVADEVGRRGYQARSDHRRRLRRAETLNKFAVVRPQGETMAEPVLVDDPAEGVRRITLNRPEKRNALNHAVRGAVIDELRTADGDPEVRVTIIRGAGECFSAGYELGDGNEGLEMPNFTAGGEGQWPRHVTDAWMGIWDLAKPVIAQVHGWCLAGGSELATGCDLVYVADDARIGYPAVRFGVPDMQFHAWFMGMRAAMEMMLTGDWVSGEEAARLGWANRSHPAERLEDEVLATAQRVAMVPSDLAQLNKRTVHRAMDVMGVRTAIRAGTELCALGMHTDSMAEFMARARGGGGLTAALDDRDTKFGDYRSDKGQS